MGDSAVVSDPAPYTSPPIQNARFAPQRSPILPPISMNAAITNVYIVIAVCRPTTVVFRSATTCVIDTFITVVSSTMTNWAVARIPATPQPTFTAAAEADSTPRSPTVASLAAPDGMESGTAHPSV